MRVRGGRAVPLKRNADDALRHCPEVREVIVIRHTGGAIDWVEGRDIWYHEACAAASPDCPPRRCRPRIRYLFFYTSGSTGQPKGVLHHRRLLPRLHVDDP